MPRRTQARPPRAHGTTQGPLRGGRLRQRCPDPTAPAHLDDVSTPVTSGPGRLHANTEANASVISRKTPRPGGQRLAAFQKALPPGTVAPAHLRCLLPAPGGSGRAGARLPGLYDSAELGFYFSVGIYQPCLHPGGGTFSAAFPSRCRQPVPLLSPDRLPQERPASRRPQAAWTAPGWGRGPDAFFPTLTGGRQVRSSGRAEPRPQSFPRVSAERVAGPFSLESPLWVYVATRSRK